ncbi:Oidioi.mRNA.OKI2018_I69.chr1.g921.t1.cds [Oikopleura dioica]|uniref:Oidioi.mRNA.OKI2018_I69.chr1.g921.t1.cds n=1 Tax=Oikopleura dioica TaxID=34765 RepID=A0ABN7SLX8_OIKDI|nr:Oidioi.mRNA.OKI2018_I69.chr1.g921.t1.cds [Oikopleura dioica]
MNVEDKGRKRGRKRWNSAETRRFIETLKVYKDEENVWALSSAALNDGTTNLQARSRLSPKRKGRKPRSKSVPAKRNGRKEDVEKKAPKKDDEKEKDLIRSTETVEQKKAKPTQKEKRDHLHRLHELNRVEKQVITPVRKPKDFRPEPEEGTDENLEPFSTPANQGLSNHAFRTPQMSAFATPAPSTSASSPTGCRFQTPSVVDFSMEKKYIETPTAKMSKKQAADRVRNAEFIRKEMEKKKLETDLFDVSGKKRRELMKATKELPSIQQQASAGEDELDEYYD